MVDVSSGLLFLAPGLIGGGSVSITLGPLTLSGSLQIGTAASGTIIGATTGSTITGNIPGITINSGARTYSGTPSGTQGSIANGLVETLAGATNNNNPSSITVASGNLPNFRTALAAAKAGTTGPLIINSIGDSTVAGTGAGNPSSAIGNNARGNNLEQALGAQFAANGLPKNGADIFGWNFPINTQTTADYLAWNTAVSSTGSWTQVSNLISICGNMWNAANATGGNFTWNGESRQFNRLVLYYLEFSGGGTFRIRIDGAAQTTINSVGGTPIVRKVVYTPTLGTHSIEWEWLTGSNYIIGMESQDTSTKASVRIRNIGLGSAKSADIIDTTTNWRSGNAIQALETASLHIIEGGVINDWLGSVGTSTTSSNLTTMMTQATANGGGDILLLGPTRTNPVSSGITLATQDSYATAMAALANGTTRAFYDLKTGVGDYTAMNGAGRMFDNIHPNFTGYAAEATVVYGYIS